MKEAHHPVGEGRLLTNRFTQQQRRYHRHVGQRENKCTQNSEADHLRHGAKHLAFDADQGQDRQIHDQNNNFAKGGRGTDLAGGMVDLLIHLGLSQAVYPAAYQMMEGGLDDDNGSVHDEAEIDGSQTHQVARDAEQAHHADGKKHGQGDHRSHDQPRPQVAQEQDQHENHNQRPLDEVAGHGVDGPADQLRAIQKHADIDTFGQRPPDLVNFGFYPANDLIGVLAF